MSEGSRESLVTCRFSAGSEVHQNRARVQSTPDPNTCEKVSRYTSHFYGIYFCKCMPSLWQKVVYTPPICITIRLPFVSRYFCGSIRVRGRWNTPKKSRNSVRLRQRFSPLPHKIAQCFRPQDTRCPCDSKSHAAAKGGRQSG